MTTAIEPRNGWHWREWLAEGAGSAIVLFAVVTAKDLSIRAGPPLSDLRWSIAIIAVVAGLAVGTVALSGLGRRSGAHLNPALTMGLWLQRTVSHADLVGYWVARLAGGVLGVALARVWGPTVPRAAVDWALLKPAPWISELTAAGVECAATGIQLAVVFALLSSRRYHRWTPPTAAAMLTAGDRRAGAGQRRGVQPGPRAGPRRSRRRPPRGMDLHRRASARGRAGRRSVRRRPATAGHWEAAPRSSHPSYMRYDLYVLEDKIADARIYALRQRHDRAAR